ncbi:hypothetical protein [Aureimonas leprariae]|uniref:Uncharacterized protein n=1 Tax=Plantimonas leprariae TaxID=2615207 RepID=A0A7V7TY32_9HYPH|nr:hypothetical protein [Aureimonas leprariae]KAB0681940.1 hypothetical protein F6X38_03770 [Aureimonas leprariae]
MTIRYADRATRNHSRQKGLGSESFDRFMDSRERRSPRRGLRAAFTFGGAFGELAEIERRSLLDTFAPVRS